MTGNGAHDYGLRLAGGAYVTFAPSSRTALVGEEAVGLIGRLSSAHGAALMLPDHAAPLHAAYSVGDQIAVALGGTRRAGLDRATDLLEAVGVPDPHARVSARPHQLGALDRQRAQLALAVANRPALLLAEDPLAHLTSAEGAAFAAALTRLHGKLRFTLVLGTGTPASAERLVDEMLILSGGQVIDRRRRLQPASSSSASSSST